MPHRSVPRRAAASAVPKSSIRERASELVRLHADLGRAYAARDGSEVRDEQWSAAAKRFQVAVLEFYEPFEGIGALIRSGDGAAIEQAMRFLEADPWCFRSGYLKADLMTALANTALAENMRSRLRPVVMHRLKHREPGLLRPASRLAANVWNDSLAHDVERVIATGDEAERAAAEAICAAVEHHRRTIGGLGGSPL